jgi:hypothetical protein
MIGRSIVHMNSAVLLWILLTSCATPTSFYGTKSVPATIGALAIQISDESDNSELRGNEFLKQEIVRRVITDLSSIGVRCISEQDTGMTPSHVLVLASGGIEKHTHMRPVETTQTYHTSTDSQGNIYNYSTPSVSGGGSYSTRTVQITATLLRRNQDGSFTKVSQSYAGGDGQGFLERRFRSTVLAPDKPISDMYISVCIEAALSLFENTTK